MVLVFYVFVSHSLVVCGPCREGHDLPLGDPTGFKEYNVSLAAPHKPKYNKMCRHKKSSVTPLCKLGENNIEKSLYRIPVAVIPLVLAPVRCIQVFARIARPDNALPTSCSLGQLKTICSLSYVGWPQGLPASFAWLFVGVYTDSPCLCHTDLTSPYSRLLSRRA